MRQKSHKESKMLAEAQDLAAKLAEVSVSIATKAGENGKIYGSINTIQLAEALKGMGPLIGDAKKMLAGMDISGLTDMAKSFGQNIPKQ